MARPLRPAVALLGAGLVAVLAVVTFVSKHSRLIYSLGHQLYDAALDDKTRKVRTLLSKPNAQSFINWQDQTGATPIYAAAEEGHTEVVKELIAARCDINRSRKDGTTPIYAAAYLGHTGVAEQLIAARCDINLAKNGETPIYAAARRGHTEVVKQLITARCDINAAQEDGQTPIFIAARRGHTGVAEQLITACCDTDRASKNGKTPLQVADSKGHGRIATLIRNEAKRKEEEKAREEELKIFREGSARVRSATAAVASAKEIASSATQRHSSAVKEETDAKTAADEANSILAAALAEEADAIEEERRIQKAHAQRASHSAAGLRALDEAKARVTDGDLRAARAALLTATREFAEAAEDRASDIEALDAVLKKEEELEEMVKAYDSSSGILSRDQYATVCRAMQEGSNPFTTSQQGAGLQSIGLHATTDLTYADACKFRTEPKEFVMGNFPKAAQGIHKLMQVDEDETLGKTLRGTEAVIEEVEKLQANQKYAKFYPVVKKYLHYVLFEISSEEKYPNGIRDKGRAGKKLSDFCEHPYAIEADLKEADVVALRLYTTPAFVAFNEALRNMDEGVEHPLPVLVTFLARAIKKLRQIGAHDVAAVSEKVLWRGMKNLTPSDEFSIRGGTELAPMSTTSSIQTAVEYSLSSESLIFMIVTRNSLQRGASVEWLSAFPTEEEIVFSPLTFLQPTGRRQIVELNGMRFTIVEVTPSN